MKEEIKMLDKWNQLNFSEELITHIFSKIDYPGNDTDCWLWKGYFNNKGYGNIGLFGKYHLAHRLIYQCYNGEINQILCVLHHCDNPKCVNPSHLFLGTRHDNIIDMVNKNRHSGQYGSMHCNAKLNEEYIKEILEGVISGKYISIRNIVAKYNVSEVIIRKIFRGLLWKRVTCQYDLQSLKDIVYNSRDNDIV